MEIQDLPEYIQKYVNTDEYHEIPNHFAVHFPDGYRLTEKDALELPKAKKWIKAHGGFYDCKYGFWYIPKK
jgi:hypothetical protein